MFLKKKKKIVYKWLSPTELEKSPMQSKAYKESGEKVVGYTPLKFLIFRGDNALSGSKKGCVL